jgi:murein L,D-transpeptidase YafK
VAVWVLASLVCAPVAPRTARAENADGDVWILVDTKAHTLSVFRDRRLLDRFHNVAIGRGGFSADKVRDDGATPLGTFHIDRINRASRFRVFFGIDYPRPEHARRALDAGRIDAEDYERIVLAFKQRRSPPQDTPLGGHLGIHGLGGGDKWIHDEFDWTQGCIALTNDQIARLSHWIFPGMRVEVR